MKFTLRNIVFTIGTALSAAQASAADLLEIYNQALINDPIVLQAKAQRDALYENIEENRSTLLPTISGNVGYDKSWSNNNVDKSMNIVDGGFSAGLTLNQVIYNHAAWKGLDIAEKSASKADIQYAQSLQTLITRVTTAYFEVLKAVDALEFSRTEKKAIARQLEQTKQRFAVGLTAITDVHEAQARFDLSVADEIFAQNALVNTYESLREITGIDYDRLHMLDTKRFSTASPVPATANGWTEKAEQSSLVLMANRLGKDIAKETIDFYKAGHMPSINANAGLNGQFSRDRDNTFQDNYNTSNVAITMSVPIFEGFRVSSQVKQAKFDYVYASEVLEQSHRSVVKNVRSSFNNVTASISVIKAYQQSVVSSEAALKAAEAGFEVGTRTIVDVLNSTRDLYNARKQLAQSRYNYINAVLSLKAAAGTLTEDDVVAVNQGLIEPTASMAP